MTSDKYNADQREKERKKLEELSVLALRRKAEKERKKFEELSALALRLQNEEYAKLYYELGDTLSHLEQATDQAIKDVTITINKQDDIINDALKKSTHLYDGRAVFKDGEDVRTLDGAKITDQALLDSIIWKENAPTYAEIRELHETKDRQETQLQELEEYRVNDLGNARDRWEDNNKPLSEKEMQDMQEHLLKQAPSSVAAIIENDISDDQPIPVASSQISQPKL